jgi:hypothetical protein
MKTKSVHYILAGTLMALLFLSGSRACAARFYLPIDMNNQPITNLATPDATSPDHQAVTKGYVDSATNAVALLKGGVDLTTVSNAFVLKSGDVMTGVLTLPGIPSGDLDAVPKIYVDGATNTVLVDAAAYTDSATNGAVLTLLSALGSATNDIGATYDDRWVNTSGDTMTGPLDVHGQDVIFYGAAGGTTNTYAVGKDNRLEIHVDGETAVRF